MDHLDRELRWLRRLREVSHRLATEYELTKLYPLILDSAIELTKAERGFLVRILGNTPGGGYHFRVVEARGFRSSALARDDHDVSRTVVRQVMESGKPLVTTSEDQILRVSSVMARRVVSIASVPIRLRNRTLGVLYLDHRFVPDAFSSQDLPILGTFAEQAAIAIDAAESLAASEGAHSLGDRSAQPSLAQPATTAASPHGSKDAPPLALGSTEFAGLLGASAPMQDLFEDIRRVACTTETILVVGESGSGKRAVAKSIHDQSDRAYRPYLILSCAGRDPDRLEQELFGASKGAPQGPRKGLLKLANDGTLVLDEVGELPSHLQARLLRVLQDKVYTEVGGGAELPVHCRIVATTRHSLHALISKQRFREDLYYRLDVLRVPIPPLRERPGDIPLLLQRKLRSAGRSLEFTPKALEQLIGYAWPGNVRQLENEVTRLLNSGVHRVAVGDLSPEVRSERGVARAGGRTIGDVQKELIVAALEACRGNKARAARQLGIPRTTLYNLIRRYKL